LSLGKKRCPEALPFLLAGSNGTSTLSIVSSNLVLVGRIEDDPHTHHEIIDLLNFVTHSL
ncbi:MAG TPA: hypothetical protein VF844_14555, partial [Ktedonobacteraceae bacterium]